ncbi:Acetyltransferase (GNAT) family protein [Seinonella peptonophila]|uniref:Acetyltransferase (GNAT) family protein n=1 Tax=Seinonella peptonophila TaxID=112248 RepID=A0A1M4SJA8_9BACL|nr:GNAT family N-acetyltransferase [Seinonella peptonophila]SHE32323.1 Acetyltransferase (GNAT) family protein [Seinonella peptonophila]
MYNSQEILLALESTALHVNNLPPEIEEFINTNERFMWVSMLDDPEYNWVTRVQFNNQNVEQKVDEIVDYYRSKKKSFNWSIGPNSSPLFLGEVMEKKGFHVINEYEGLAFDLQTSNIKTQSTDHLKMKRVQTTQELKDFINIRHAGMNEKDQNLWISLRSKGLEKQQDMLVIAYLDQTPVGTASFRLSADRKIVYFADAVVLPQYRQRGIYKHLIEYRMRLSRQLKCHVVITIANVNTSSPILKKWGFKSYCLMTDYRLLDQT